MSQEDYDSGYENGCQSMDGRIASLEQDLKWAREDLAREREEIMRYRSIVYRPVSINGQVPF